MIITLCLHTSKYAITLHHDYSDECIYVFTLPLMTSFLDLTQIFAPARAQSFTNRTLLVLCPWQHEKVRKFIDNSLPPSRAVLFISRHQCSDGTLLCRSSSRAIFCPGL